MKVNAPNDVPSEVNPERFPSSTEITLVFASWLALEFGQWLSGTADPSHYKAFQSGLRNKPIRTDGRVLKASPLETSLSRPYSHAGWSGTKAFSHFAHRQHPLGLCHWLKM